MLRYLAFAYGITSILMLPVVLAARGIWPAVLPSWWEGVAAFGPFVAAILALRGEPEFRATFWRELKRWRASTRGYALTLASPLLFLAVAIAVWIARGGELAAVPSQWALRFADVAAVAHLVIVVALLQSVGEEPGWRGYLLPRLRGRFGPVVATLTLWPLWTLWHVPQFLARADFGMAQFAGFSLGILASSVWLTAIREETSSTLHAIVWHALTNITRNLALALSIGAFLAYGGAVTVGALALAIGHGLRRRR